MKTYDVTIRATITKTIRVEAEDIDAAIAEAHEDFTVADCNFYDDYDEATLDIGEVKS